MSLKRSCKIALAFVGLLVGAGFATGQEVIQYFLSFGAIGLVGAVVAGVVFALAGAVIIQLGSFYLAEEHNRVFRSVANPVISRFLDIAVTLTLFAVGFVMLAGAGSTLEQQWGFPAWAGAAVMTVIVMLVGLLDVEKVSDVISMLTPLIILAVIVAFIYTMANLPQDFSQLSSVAQEQASPVQPWLLSALNYNGLALLLGVSMCLVIGGNNAEPREAGLGGLMGGILYTVLLLMAAVALYFNMAEVGDSAVPMLQLFEAMHPVLATIMVFIIFAMIFNTAIGMFYALGRRLTASHRDKYRPVFLLACLLGYGVSFAGFDTLMKYVYPVIGYTGMVMIVVMVFGWARYRTQIAEETTRRGRLRALLRLRRDPGKDYAPGHEKRYEEAVRQSPADDDRLTQVLESRTEQDLELSDDEGSAEHDGDRAPA
ncbi:YkvI family membrane protein [Kocuria palustris]|uniref:YkvI family membrane protein n=1 Tax=Kocuria palustris TaxID=71999 RepID=UPI0035DCC0FD